MKRFFLCMALIAGAAVLLSAQGPAVVIENAEKASFHYVVDPPELTAFDTDSSVFRNVVYDYFAVTPAAADDFAGFQELEPGGLVRFEDLTEGAHLLVGFFVMPGQREFPVRVITLQVGGGLDERTYRVYGTPALITARAGRGRIGSYAAIPATAVTAGAESSSTTGLAAAGETGEAPGFFRFQIDNQYEDWEAIPSFLSFAADRRIEAFTREQYGGAFEVFPLSASRNWGAEGTSVNEIKVVNNRDAVYLYVSTHSTLSPNVSLFLYFHSQQNLKRTGAVNRFTLELVPARAQKPGLVVLWEQNRKPLIVGKLASGSFFLEAKIDKGMLHDILTAKPEITFFDLTTCYYDRQELAFEEYPIATISLAQIPTENNLY